MTVADGPGYTELMDEPHRSLAPEKTYAIVVGLAGRDGWRAPESGPSAAAPEVAADRDRPP